MDVPSQHLDLCTAAGPIVAATTRRLAARHHLQPCDREDVEQELYLQLMIRRTSTGSAAPPAGVMPTDRATDSGSPAHPLAAANAQLSREVERIANVIASSWPCRRPRYPAHSQRLTPSRIGRLPGRPTDDMAAHELRMDLALALVLIPADLRHLCHRLANDGRRVGDEVALPHLVAVAPADGNVAVARLRSLFASLDLHHYL